MRSWLPLLALLTLTMSPAQAEDWGPLNFLIGNWVGEGSGKPGEATGAFSLLPDLQGAVLVRKNFAEYPALANLPFGMTI